MPKSLKVLSISSMLPLRGGKKENDIILRIYQELGIRRNLNYKLLKALNWAPFPLYLIKDKWRFYRELANKGNVIHDETGQRIEFYRWLSVGNSISVQRTLSRLNFLFFGKKVISGVKVFQPDLVHAHTFNPDGYVAFRLLNRLNIPYVLTLRMREDQALEDHPLRRKIIEGASKVIVHNYSVYQKYRDEYELLYFPHAIDDIFFEKPRSAHPTLESMKPAIRLVTVCRFQKSKNIGLVIRALGVLARKNIKFEYRIIGEGAEKKAYTKLIDAEGVSDQVTITGWKTKKGLIEELDKCDVFIMVSKPETLGRVYLEAAARNLPIIGCKGSGVDGYFTNEEADFLEPELEAVISSLESLGNKGLGRLQDKARLAKKKVECLRWGAVTDWYMEIYENVVNLNNYNK